MKIRAKVTYSAVLSEVVTIIAFVTKYDCTYAVTVDSRGKLSDYPIEDLTVLENDMK